MPQPTCGNRRAGPPGGCRRGTGRRRRRRTRFRFAFFFQCAVRTGFQHLRALRPIAGTDSRGPIGHHRRRRDRRVNADGQRRRRNRRNVPPNQRAVHWSGGHAPLLRTEGTGPSALFHRVIRDVAASDHGRTRPARSRDLVAAIGGRSRPELARAMTIRSALSAASLNSAHALGRKEKMISRHSGPAVYWRRGDLMKKRTKIALHILLVLSASLFT